MASLADKPILAGIFLLLSAKNAVFLNKNVPGVQIPDQIIQRLADAPHPLDEGIKIADEHIKFAQQLSQGVHIMAIKREDLVPKILGAAGMPPIHNRDEK